MVTPFAEGAILRAGRHADWVSIDQLIGDGALLVLAPHPDDESLGCGAALAAVSRTGRKVVVAALTDGRMSHPRSKLYPPERLIALRQHELIEAVARLTLNAGTIIHLGYPDQGMTDNDRLEARNRLIEIVDHYGIGTIWTTWEGDPHPDHRLAARLAGDVARARNQLALWRFPIWGRFIERAPYESEQLYRFATEAFRTEKAAGIAAHRSQMTTLIQDDPDGFVMNELMQTHFLSSPEFFLSEPIHARARETI